MLLVCAMQACFFSVKTIAQHMWSLHVIPLDEVPASLSKNLKHETQFADTSLLMAALPNILARLHGQSYLEASFDSLHWQDSTLHAWLHIGGPYGWAALANGNVDKEFLDRSGFREKLYRGKPLDFTEIKKMQERLLEQAENNGFPFASVYLDSIEWNSDGAMAKIFMDKNRLVFFDSLNVEGDANISVHYLRSYLGIRQGGAYSRRRVLRIRDRLRELPFLREKSNALITFEDDRANVRLFLEKRKASRFDFLVGVLPDNGRPETRLLVTGTFNAEFQNAFGLGERIYAAFERLRPQTQRLELAFAYPYILDLPFGVDLKFNQYKRDSTFTDIIGEFGVQYLFEGGNYLKAFWNSTASNLLAVDTAAIRQGRFPAQLDVKNSAFGLEGNWQRLDYRFNPRRGWAVMLKGGAGTRNIRRNQAILNVAENFYDTLPGRTFRFVLEGKVERYFPLMQRSALKLAVRSGAILSQEPVYLNEQFRIGGNRLMRGFDEEGVFATVFNVTTAEYRLLIGQNSWFYLFGDQGYVEDRRAGQPDRYRRLLGFGGGLTFETTAGVFGISLAVGKVDGTPLDFRNPKVHFGYVSIF